MSVFLLISILFLNGFTSLPLSNEQQDPTLVEGDIKINPTKSLASSSKTNRWPNGIVPYLIDPKGGYTAVQIGNIKRAMKILENKTRGAVKFIPKTNVHKNWLHIKSLNGCYSYIGMNGGEQELSLSKNGCTSTGTAVHEFCHALGFWHEQNRPDRDNFVTIKFGNIKEDKVYNFNKYTMGTYYGTAYDYKSIMHYDNKAFSKNGQDTIIPKQPGIVLKPSHLKTDAEILTAADILAIQTRYKFN